MEDITKSPNPGPELVFIDKHGKEYYYGSPKNPYNFFDVKTPFESLEAEKIRAEAGPARIKKWGEPLTPLRHLVLVEPLKDQG